MDRRKVRRFFLLAVIVSEVFNVRISQEITVSSDGFVDADLPLPMPSRQLKPGEPMKASFEEMHMYQFSQWLQTHRISWDGMKRVEGPPPAARVHCVGENFVPDISHRERTCRYKNLCWYQGNVVVYQDDLQARWDTTDLGHNLSASSTRLGQSVLLLPPEPSEPWTPTTITNTSDIHYHYVLPSNITVVLFKTKLLKDFIRTRRAVASATRGFHITNPVLSLNDVPPNNSAWVCAPDAVVGGGWEVHDTRWVGRGDLDYMDVQQTNRTLDPSRVVLLPGSSSRGTDWIAPIVESLSSLDLEVLVFRDSGDIDDIILFSPFLWVVEAGTLASYRALSLPRGANVVLLYNSPRRKKPDKDIWMHVSHIKVHWLPCRRELDADSLGLLYALVKEELRHMKDTAINYETSNFFEHEATFAGFPVRYVDETRYSSLHTYSETLDPDYRSAEFHHLCFDTNTSRFQIVASPEQLDLIKMLSHQSPRWNPYIVSNSFHDKGMPDGKQIRQMHTLWFPEIVENPYRGFYELPDDVLWIPYWGQAENMRNMGHTLWDFFLPFYTLSSMFGLKDKRLLVMDLQERCSGDEKCSKTFHKFSPMIGQHELFTTRHHAGSGLDRSSVVCVKHGAFGIGFLTDNGMNRHGQTDKDLQRMVNGGRGYQFYDFRNYIVKNLAVDEVSAGVVPWTVTFASNSSNNKERRRDFQKQVDYLNNQIGPGTAIGLDMATFSVVEQIQIIQETNMFVTVAGGATSIAMFLKPDSSLVIYYPDDHPQMLDFDFWNNANWIRVHWLPLSRMDDDMRVLLGLVQSETKFRKEFQK